MHKKKIVLGCELAGVAIFVSWIAYNILGTCIKYWLGMHMNFIENERLSCDGLGFWFPIWIMFSIIGSAFSFGMWLILTGIKEKPVMKQR